MSDYRPEVMETLNKMEMKRLMWYRYYSSHASMAWGTHYLALWPNGTQNHLVYTKSLIVHKITYCT